MEQERRALNVIMLGPPGAGKGTQAARFAARHSLPKISTGDILREAVHDDTPIGRAAKTTMYAGRLVGDEVIIAIVSERLARPDAQRGFVLDGFPRTVTQATALDGMVDGRGPLVVIDIVVPEEVLTRRLAMRRICGICGTTAPVEWTTLCGTCGGSLVHRKDDSDAVVVERLKVYQQQTRPIVEFYRSRPTFRKIDGNLTPDAVTDAIEAAIGEASAVVPGGARL